MFTWFHILIIIFIDYFSVNVFLQQRPGEILKECGDGFIRTCTDREPWTDINGRGCGPTGYYCIDNYVRDHKGDCIPLTACKCGSNEMLLINCTVYNNNKGNKEKNCIYTCKCRPGYIKIEGDCKLKSTEFPLRRNSLTEQPQTTHNENCVDSKEVATTHTNPVDCLNTTTVGCVEGQAEELLTDEPSIEEPLIEDSLVEEQTRQLNDCITTTTTTTAVAPAVKSVKTTTRSTIKIKSKHLPTQTTDCTRSSPLLLSEINPDYVLANILATTAVPRIRKYKSNIHRLFKDDFKFQSSVAHQTTTNKNTRRPPFTIIRYKKKTTRKPVTMRKMSKLQNMKHLLDKLK